MRNARAIPASERPAREVTADDRAADDQTAADADQTRADSDQTAADNDQTAADSDERASSADQAASDADQTSADLDDETGDESSHRRREATKADRATVSRERHATQTERFRTADRREQTADARDRRAVLRDERARQRDRRAAELERAVAEVDPKLAARLEAVRVQTANDRAAAAVDRARAAADRARAAGARANLEVELRRSHLDGLTGAYRREIGCLALAHEVDRARRGDGRLIVAFVDVDDLHGINDREGHAAGDQALRAVVATMASHLRSFDPIFRYGGDEFVAAMGRSDLADAERRFTSIARTLLETARVRISVGFAALEEGDTASELMARADAELLRVRRASDHAGSRSEAGHRPVQNDDEYSPGVLTRGLSNPP